MNLIASCIPKPVCTVQIPNSLIDEASVPRMRHRPISGAAVRAPRNERSLVLANKDLVRRAFSVTANLPSQRKEYLENAGEEDDASVPRAVDTLGEQRRNPIAGPPKTGPGSMLAFMTDQSEVHQEVVKLRERVEEFKGAELAKRLDPGKIVASKWANRDPAHFQTEAFARLKSEIASAGGNIQPIKVRALVDGAEEGFSWEIVFGHRRHRACLELGLPVLSLVQKDMKDVDLFVEMERENREREDLSAWEQGVMYMRALELGLFPSAKQMAIAIDRDMGNISRAMALAKLPNDVIQAFGSPLNLQFRWASPLKEAHQKDPEGLLEIARELAARAVKPAPAAVFAILTRADGVVANGTEAEWNDAAGKRIAHLMTDRKGRATLSFDTALDAVQHKKLVKLVDGLLNLKS